MDPRWELPPCGIGQVHGRTGRQVALDHLNTKEQARVLEGPVNERYYLIPLLTDRRNEMKFGLRGYSRSTHLRGARVLQETKDKSG